MGAYAVEQKYQHGGRMTPVAVVCHPKRRHFHASLSCATTTATEDTLRVRTERMARSEGRKPCTMCWSPEGYIVIPDRIALTFGALRETA
jgi:hypothetical protein